MLQLPPNPPSIRLPLDWHLEAALKMGFEFPKIGWREEDCKTCLGSKVVRTWLTTPLSEVVEFPCNCVEQMILSRYLGIRGIPLDLRRRGFVDANWIKSDVRDKLTDWTKRPADLAMRERGVIISGASGGKSLVASLLQRLMLQHEVDAFMVMMQMLGPDGRIGNYKGSDYDEIQEFWTKVVSVAPVLVIDRVESAGGMMSDWSKVRVANLIEQRRGAERMTIITTSSAELMRAALPEGSKVTDGFKVIEMQSDFYPLDEIKKRESDERIIRPIVMG